MRFEFRAQPPHPSHAKANYQDPVCPLLVHVYALAGISHIYVLSEPPVKVKSVASSEGCMHRIHANHCVACGEGVSASSVNKRKDKEEPLLCYNCHRNPPERYRCGAINSQGKPCRQVGRVRFGGRCNFHK